MWLKDVFLPKITFSTSTFHECSHTFHLAVWLCLTVLFPDRQWPMSQASTSSLSRVQSCSTWWVTELQECNDVGLPVQSFIVVLTVVSAHLNVPKADSTATRHPLIKIPDVRKSDGSLSGSMLARVNEPSDRSSREDATQPLVSYSLMRSTLSALGARATRWETKRLKYWCHDVIMSPVALRAVHSLIASLYHTLSSVQTSCAGVCVCVCVCVFSQEQACGWSTSCSQRWTA